MDCLVSPGDVIISNTYGYVSAASDDQPKIPDKIVHTFGNGENSHLLPLWLLVKGEVVNLAAQKRHRQDECFQVDEFF